MKRAKVGTVRTSGKKVWVCIGTVNRGCGGGAKVRKHTRKRK